MARKMADKSHSIRVRGDRWTAIEKKAWQLSKEADRIIKPTDVADTLLWKGIKELTIADVQMAKEARN